MPGEPSVVLLTGGLGGSRLSPILRAHLPERLTVIANVGDDVTVHGLRVCPDLDANFYGLAGLFDRERGWGRSGETTVVQDELRGLGENPWFSLGDRDLAFHVWRGDRLREGASLAAVMRQATAAKGIDDVELLPACEASAETAIECEDGRVLAFQEWYVRERADPPVRRVHLAAGPAAPAAIAALAKADAVILGPSNPVASIGAILELEGMRDAVAAVPLKLVVTPVVTRAPSASPSVAHHSHARANLLRAEGARDVPAEIAARYAKLADVFVLDRRDAGEAPEIEALGLDVTLTDTLAEASLGKDLVDLVHRASPAPGG